MPSHYLVSSFGTKKWPVRKNISGWPFKEVIVVKQKVVKD